jgi:DNA-directed RNA polymerase specialized sigma24 family protein
MGRSLGFPTTAWSLISKAEGGLSREAHTALASLCEAYWQPLYRYALVRGYTAEDARDLTQGYFALLLEKHYLADVRPREGRFRSFLLSSFMNFVSKERDRTRALKRGGGKVLVPLDAWPPGDGLPREAVDGLTPEIVFERQWALAVLERALERLRRDSVAAGKEAEFERLSAYLTGREPREPYRDIALDLGTNEDAIKATVHRLRRRYGRLLREEIAATVADPQDVDDELRHLLSVVQPWEPPGHR